MLQKSLLGIPLNMPVQNFKEHTGIQGSPQTRSHESDLLYLFHAKLMAVTFFVILVDTQYIIKHNIAKAILLLIEVPLIFRDIAEYYEECCQS